MRKGYVIILALILVIAAAFWRVQEDHLPRKVSVPSSVDLQQLPETEVATFTPSAVTPDQPKATPAPLEKPDEKLTAAKKHLPWMSEEKLKMLIKSGVNIENIERGTSQSSHELALLDVAVREYRKLIGEYPGGTNVEIATALLGENPKKQVFIEWRKKQLSQSGELLDPWGTPYEMGMIGDILKIRSAGPDRVFGTADDEIP